MDSVVIQLRVDSLYKYDINTSKFRYKKKLVCIHVKLRKIMQMSKATAEGPEV